MASWRLKDDDQSKYIEGFHVIILFLLICDIESLLLNELLHFSEGCKLIGKLIMKSKRGLMISNIELWDRRVLYGYWSILFEHFKAESEFKWYLYLRDVNVLLTYCLWSTKITVTLVNPILHITMCWWIHQLIYWFLSRKSRLWPNMVYWRLPCGYVVNIQK
jgi:hypothetical protein